MIPKIIHFVIIGDRYDWMNSNIDTFIQHNPDYTFMIHDDGNLLDIYKQQYQYCTTKSMKSDLVRFSVLQKFGGWYFDTDCRCYGSMDKLYDLYQLGQDLITCECENSDMLSTYFLGADINCITWPLINNKISEAEPPYTITTFSNTITSDIKQSLQLISLNHISNHREWYHGAEMEHGVWHGNNPPSDVIVVHGGTGIGLSVTSPT